MLYRFLLVAVTWLSLVQAAMADGYINRGRTLAKTHCARCHVIGDFNNWQLNPDYLMKKDGDYFWRPLRPKLNPDVKGTDNYIS